MSGIVIDVKKSCREYLIPTDNIIVLHHFFNLMKTFESHWQTVIRSNTIFW